MSILERLRLKLFPQSAPVAVLEQAAPAADETKKRRERRPPSYEVLSVEAFGRQLITSRDLDPVYVALREATLPAHQLNRWLVAYWCFYDVGAASFLSERDLSEFWEAMHVAAVNSLPTPLGTRWPRKPERRHFRGTFAISAVGELAERYPDPASMVDSLVHRDDESPLPYATLAARVKAHKGFGDWIAFKAADMSERCGVVPVAFDEAAVSMFTGPVESARRIWHEWGYTETNPDASIRGVVERLSEEFSDLLAPPLMDRPVGIQEIETVICKHQSHCNGHYALMHDTAEMQETLRQWSIVSETAAALLATC